MNVQNLPVIINSEWLTKHYACREQKEAFEKEWPNGGVITRKNLVRAAEIDLNLDWLADEILPGLLGNGYRAEISALYEKYSEKVNPFYIEYRRKSSLLNAEFQEKITPLFEKRQVLINSFDFEKDVKYAELYTEYDEQVSLLRIECDDSVSLNYKEYETHREILHNEYRKHVKSAALVLLCKLYKD